MYKEWHFNSDNLGDKSLIERLLFSRGITDEKDVYEFLHPLEISLTKPEVFCDMQKAVQRLVKAIDEQEKILIYGDFDADGVTSTSLLLKTLKFLGANVDYYIPNRDDNHGLNSKSIVSLMTTIKPKVIVTVDCGISNVAEIAMLKSFSVDVILTDHHEAPQELPQAFAIINPKAQNALSETLSTKEIEGLTSLAGVGVAFKVAQALLNCYEKTNFVFEILPFVAVGTIADVVPLVRENRYFVTKGLQLISNHYGLTKLLESAGYKDKITAENVAFGIAPRINASGRLDTVKDSVTVLVSDNKSEIDMAIISLNQLNKIRQELCEEVFLQADEMVQNSGNKNPAIVLFNKEWHNGIIGIVASKLVEKYYKPTFLMTYDEERNQIRCSARGIEGLSLYEILKENSDLLDGFGGHALAAGFSFTETGNQFEVVKNALNNTVKEFLNGRDLKPFVNIDLELQPNEITFELIDELAKMEPFGASNPSPVFAIKDCVIKEKRLMGENNTHLRLTVVKDNAMFTCVRWSLGDIALVAKDSLDIAFHPQINEFKGNTSIQLIVDDIHSEYLKKEVEQENTGVVIYDHRKKTDILPLVNDYVKKSQSNIKVFAECKSVKDTLMPYKYLTQRIFDRENVSPCDVLMFFDYPADKETFDKIVSEANPQKIHFMKYDLKHFDEKDFIATFLKMLRYACNNTDGKVNLLRCASALGKSYEIVLSILDLLEEIEFIKINERNYEFYKIELLNITDLSKILDNVKYDEIKLMIQECENFQEKLLKDDLSTIVII